MIRRLHKKKGSVLVFTLVMTTVLLIIFTGMIQYVVSTIQYSLHEVKREKAINIAEAGIQYYRWYLAHEADGLTAGQVENFWKDTNPQGVDTPYEADYQGIGAYQITVTPPTTGSNSIIVESTGWSYGDPSTTRTIRVRMRRAAWCEDVLFSNSNLLIADGTETFGPVHSNGGVYFNGVAHNEVSSAVSTYSYGGVNKSGVWTTWANEYNTNMGSSVFLGGKAIGTGEEDFDNVLVNFDQLFAEAHILGFDWGSAAQGHQIVLKGNKIDVYKMTGSAVNSDGTVKDSKKQLVASNVSLPDVAVIYVGKNVWVEGTLGSGKRLTISTIHSGGVHGNIYLSKSITYEDYTSGTVLGLVAEGNVEVVKGSQDNLHIDGVLFAQNGSVYRTDTSAKTSIQIYGAIVVDNNYGFSGYNHVTITYDPNLLYVAPPFFPTRNEYIVDLWEES